MEIASELESGDATLEIPWASPNQPHLKYVDLRKFPEKFASLTECRNNPALARLLQRVNVRGSIFRTAKCDVWVSTKLAHDDKLDFQFPLKVSSYVDLVFERSDLRSRFEPHLRLAKKLERSLAGRHLPARIDIVVRRCLFHGNGHWGYSLTLFVHAYGATRSQAKEEWGRALVSLGDALLRIAPSFIKKRTKGLDPPKRGAI
ncbi:MAG TPA: hypothetical protein VG028_16095 [Terriglobia bacterium]|nr:hypothetical protein [Terriglobia bacterium]